MSVMQLAVRRLTPAALVFPLVLFSATACDIVTAELKQSAKAEWRKTYDLQPGGRVEVDNVNGKISVEPATGSAVEIVAEKTARGATEETAKQALDRIEIHEESSPSAVKIETRLPRGNWMEGSSGQVRYTVRVPAGIEVALVTVNGGVEATGIDARMKLEATNGGVVARNVSGQIDASTTNGGVDVDVAQLSDEGVRLECTNGGIRLRLPSDARATISASVTNGGIDAGGLRIETTESTRRKLEGRLNGGGARVRIEGTNGGIRISSR
jgi:bifunctional DNA-binding transcriptional regulator/antitoxin component of YhaV-PrlF toxin-antitoxin module